MAEDPKFRGTKGLSVVNTALNGSAQDERRDVLASFFFFLQILTQQAISGTSAAIYKVMEPH